jgi:hypothetical protein
MHADFAALHRATLGRHAADWVKSHVVGLNSDPGDKT